MADTKHYVTPAEVERACKTYRDIYEPSQPATIHGRRVLHGKGNRGDALRAVLQEFLKRRSPLRRHRSEGGR